MSMHPRIERAAERLGYWDRGKYVNAPGESAGRLSGEMATDFHRTSDRHTLSQATAHRAKSSARHGVKPSGGKIQECDMPPQRPGQDDGSEMFADWRKRVKLGGAIEEPDPKTKSQRDLLKLIAQHENGEADNGETIRAGIETIRQTDPKQARTFRLWVANLKLYHR